MFFVSTGMFIEHIPYYLVATKYSAYINAFSVWSDFHFVKVSKKANQSRYTPCRRLGERRYSSYSFTTSALDGGEWSASRPGRAFTPG
jgi:hypothetical protein